MPQSGSWLPAYQSIWTHRKTFELAALLGVNETYAAAHVLRLCSWALDNAPDGDLAGLSDRAIAYGAGWHQEVGLFVAALVKSGYLDDDRRIHDWMDYAGKLLVRREKDAERKQKSRGQAPDVTRTSNGAAHGVRRTEQNRTGEERTGENPTPRPPPSEGERVLTAATTEDVSLWERARDAASDGMLPANAERIGALEPIGRGPDGGLRLRAPPDVGPMARFVATIRAGLEQVGDEHGRHAQIVAGG